jgi:hypothetical protein
MRMYNQRLATGLNGWLLNALLIVAGVFFAAWTINIWVRPEPAFSPLGPGHAAKAVRPRAAARPGAASYSLIASKDIFSSSRGSGAGPVVSRRNLPANALAKAPDMTLLGTVILDDGRAAIISLKGMENDAKYYKKGERIQGFVIKKIERDAVLLESGRQTIRLPMSTPPGGGAVNRPVRRFVPKR